MFIVTQLECDTNKPQKLHLSKYRLGHIHMIHPKIVWLTKVKNTKVCVWVIIFLRQTKITYQIQWYLNANKKRPCFRLRKMLIMRCEIINSLNSESTFYLCHLSDFRCPCLNILISLVRFGLVHKQWQILIVSCNTLYWDKNKLLQTCIFSLSTWF